MAFNALVLAGSRSDAGAARPVPGLVNNSAARTMSRMGLNRAFTSASGSGAR